MADHAYTIPGTPHERRLVVYERSNGPARAATSAEAGRRSGFTPGEVRDVTSDSNPICKLGRDVLNGRGIRKHGRALVAGPRLVAEVLEQLPEQVEAWLTDHGGLPPPRMDLLWYRFADPLFRSLDVSGTHAPLLWSAFRRCPSGRTPTPGPRAAHSSSRFRTRRTSAP